MISFFRTVASVPPSSSKALLFVPTNSTLPSSTSTSTQKSLEHQLGEELCETIIKLEDFYQILGVERKVSTEDIRRGFLSRSRIIHPDKLPHYADATPAFQRLSFAYETLSKPSSRRLYDLGGGRAYDSTREGSSNMGDETLNGVLRSVFTEFLDGDFEMIRVFVNALNEGNPGLNLGDEAIDNLEGAFRKVRETLLAGQKYLRLLRFEIIRLYEIQHSLRSLSYLDFIGRLRLTLALTRVTLEIPMVLDKAMREEPIHTAPFNNRPSASSSGSASEQRKGKKSNSQNKENQFDTDATEEDESGSGTGSFGNSNHGGELLRRGLLGPRVKGVLVLACRVLERAEKFTVDYVAFGDSYDVVVE